MLPKKSNMKTHTFIFILLVGLVFHSCSKEKRGRKKLKGEWTVTEHTHYSYWNDGGTRTSEEHSNVGTITFTGEKNRKGSILEPVREYDGSIDISLDYGSYTVDFADNFIYEVDGDGDEGIILYMDYENEMSTDASYEIIEQSRNHVVLERRVAYYDYYDVYQMILDK